MSIVKDFRFPVRLDWEQGHITHATGPLKPELQITTPPDFHHGVPGSWSPEDLLVAASASCFALTLEAVAERYELPLHRVSVHAAGHVTKREDGKLGFVAIELEADVTTDAAHVDAVREAASRAEKVCIVSLALDVPVHVNVYVTPTPALAAVA